MTGTARSLRLLWCRSQITMPNSILCSSYKSPESRHFATTNSSNTISKDKTHPKDERPKNSTVDSQEIQMFSQTKDWWNPNGPMKALHSMNMIRIPFIRDGLIESEEKRSLTPLRGKKILDVGCGGGILAEGLARIGAVVTGIDASKELIAMALEHRDVDPIIVDNKPNYYIRTVEDHAVDHVEYYDGVIASEVIEHVNNQDLFVKACVKALKPGGKIFFTTPNRTRVSQFASIFFAEYVLGLLPKGTHHYEKFITPTELSFLLERNNCHVEIIYGTMYHFLTNTWEFTSFQQIMYAMQAVKLKS